MAAEWEEAPAEVVEIAEKLIALYHPDLTDASIGLLFRSEAPVSNGKITYGQCKKVGKDVAVFLDYDFLIWFAADSWGGLSERQREALVDHELCHAAFKADHSPYIRPHDFEEFDCIIERHGFWRPNGDRTVIAVQRAFPLDGAKRGKVEAVDMKRIFQGVKEGPSGLPEAAFPDTEITFAGMDEPGDGRPLGTFPTTAVNA